LKCVERHKSDAQTKTAFTVELNTLTFIATYPFAFVMTFIGELLNEHGN